MYQSAFTYRPRSVRFCQWSRKAYAAFASLKIQVTMGCVSKGITEVALSKNGYTAERQSSLQEKTGLTLPEEASRASGTEAIPLPPGTSFPKQEKPAPAIPLCLFILASVPFFCLALLSVIFIRHG